MIRLGQRECVLARHNAYRPCRRPATGHPSQRFGEGKWIEVSTSAPRCVLNSVPSLPPNPMVAAGEIEDPCPVLPIHTARHRRRRCSLLAHLTSYGFVEFRMSQERPCDEPGCPVTVQINDHRGAVAGELGHHDPQLQRFLWFNTSYRPDAGPVGGHAAARCQFALGRLSH